MDREAAAEALRLRLDPRAEPHRRRLGVWSERGSPVSERWAVLDAAGNLFVREGLGAQTTLRFHPLATVGLFDPLAALMLPPPTTLRLRVARRCADARRLPYSYEFAPSRAVDTGSLRVGLAPRLTVVAAPGVEVSIDREPWPVEVARGAHQALRPVPARHQLAMRVVRVQDPQAVPSLGLPYEPTEGRLVEQASRREIPPFVATTTRDDGVEFTLFENRPALQGAGWAGWLGAQAGLTLDPFAPKTLRLRVPPESGDERFAFALARSIHDASRFELRLACTEGVVREIVGGDLERRRFLARVDVVEAIEPFARVPATVPAGFRGRPATLTLTPPDLLLDLLDVCLGVLPVVGDLADIADIAAYATRGTDKWGRPMTPTEAALLHLGAGLPWVGGGALRVGGKVGARLPDVLERLDAVVDAWRQVPAARRAELLTLAHDIASGAP
ncbi:MAG: hypothetical protein AAGC60_01415 [Acidobacteriota bacterium]